MAGIQNESIASTLTLLSNLPDLASGIKVRFLGCVTNYSTKTATLTLEHNYPPGNKVQAIVDAGLLVSSLKSDETQIGEWINVIGYIQAPRQKLGKHSNNIHLRTEVQAIVLWSAGPLKLDGYEKSLEQQKLDRQQF
ncbi:hypothetical protein OIDMADRAFT_113385 [Oidiodendron maius Zn]|uniref:CST complex subunit Ten1 n=1 Tax=Oidiodendron maius (strain Zn) TaxID=913774 RepID=A0A0C3HEP0_OIDMZ|nr:hypothetical protein OIDMADRAFT_113385 [Oidiodendron maius Zn]